MRLTSKQWALAGAGVVAIMAVSARHKILIAREYIFTPEDKTWLLRAVEAEGPIREDVARTLVNLFVYLRSAGYNKSLTDLIRSYAQPVNPLWFVSGSKFRERPRSAVETKRAQLRESSHSTRTTFSPDTIAAVDTALSSGWDKDWTDYAAPFLDARSKGYVQKTPHIVGQNTFWSRYKPWGGYQVMPGNILVKA